MELFYQKCVIKRFNFICISQFKGAGEYRVYICVLEIPLASHLAPGLINSSHLTSEPQPGCLDQNQTDKNDSNRIILKGRIVFCKQNVFSLFQYQRERTERNIYYDFKSGLERKREEQLKVFQLHCWIKFTLSLSALFNI